MVHAVKKGMINMVSRVWVINSVLAIALVICMSNIWDVWHTSTQISSEKRSVADKKEAIQIKKSPRNLVLKASDYQSVVKKNLFSPDRAAAVPASEVVEPEVQDVRISGEKIVLYGVVIADDYKKALINNPGERNLGVKNRWVREGEHVGNLTVQQIRQDEILLIDGADSYRVLLYDPEKASKISGKSATRSSKSATRRSKEEGQPKVITAGKNPRPVEKKINKQNKFQEKKTISADGKYELIETPLGTIKRKRK